jgi:catechol 2,3-dioxygenase-like lactoylglutathione lyase family enzyme
MSKITMIHHINIQITDRQRTREWYEKVLDAQFLDRGPALNKRQLQLRIGSSEIHTSDVDEVVEVPRVHFAVEVEDWDGMLSHLDALGVPYSRSPGGSSSNIGGSDPYQGRREDTNEHFTYISDPDSNMIELVSHPLGLEDSQGTELGLTQDADNVRWTQIAGFVEDAYKSEPAQKS